VSLPVQPVKHCINATIAKSRSIILNAIDAGASFSLPILTTK
jgi:hypothetical protein